MTPPKSTVRQRERSVRTGPFLFDRGLVRAALGLTDPAVTTEEQAAALFREYARGRPTSHDELAAWMAAGESVEQAAKRGELIRRGAPSDDFGIPTFYTFDWESAQSWLRKWLPEIAQADRLSPSRDASLCREMNRALFVGEFDIRLARREGNRDLVLGVMSDSILAASTRAMLPFLLEPYGWPPHWLARCELKECGKWFLRQGKTGTKELYCDPKHASLARIRRYRGKRAS